MASLQVRNSDTCSSVTTPQTYMLTVTLFTTPLLVAGRIVMGLFGKTVPKTAENFRCVGSFRPSSVHFRAACHWRWQIEDACLLAQRTLHR